MSENFIIENSVKSGIENILEKHKDPFYLYNAPVIRDTCRKFKTIPYPELEIHFASMANDNPEFLKIIENESINIFVNSPMHLSCAQNAGFAGKRIIYTASAMTEECMRRVHACGALVNHDSLLQVATWRKLFPEAPFGVRCNIGALIEPRKTRGGYFLGKESRLGISLEDLTTLYGNNDITGVHVYVGTDIYDIHYFRECYEALCSIALNFPSLEYVDFGGGFGSDSNTGDNFNFKTYGEMLCDVMEALNSKVGRRLKCILEPGRIIGAQSGYFVCRVIDVKSNGAEQLAGVNASAVQFPRPLFYPETAFHPVTVLDDSRSDKTQLTSRIYGCSTYSRDFLSGKEMLPQLCIGDIIVLGDAGAYCASSHTQFLGFPKAKEFFHGN